MARTVKDARLDTRNVRLKLAPRREPYWRSISEGLAIGYRRGAKGGTWIARHYTADTSRRFHSLGTADDNVDADGVHVLSFSQAQERAREWFRELARTDAGEVSSLSYTVGNALDDYVAAYVRRGGRGADQLRYTIEAHIRPRFGHCVISSLRRSQVEDWLAKLASAPVRRRTGRFAAVRKVDPIDPSDQDAVRRRQASANRILTVLKAALNLAVENRYAVSSDAWSAVRPFRGADVAKVRYLSDEEARRLIRACSAEAKPIIVAALLTGCRYGEIAGFKVQDFDAAVGTLYVSRTKSGKPRHVVLTAEAVEHFTVNVVGKPSGALVFTRASGAVWAKSDQFRPIRDACRGAGIEPAVSFHILRHTYASRLARNGVPMAVIARQLGHTDTRITEKHYAHLAPSYVSESIRAAFPTMLSAPHQKF